MYMIHVVLELTFHLASSPYTQHYMIFRVAFDNKFRIAHTVTN